MWHGSTPMRRNTSSHAHATRTAMHYEGFLSNEGSRGHQHPLLTTHQLSLSPTSPSAVGDMKTSSSVQNSHDTDGEAVLDQELGTFQKSPRMPFCTKKT